MGDLTEKTATGVVVEELTRGGSPRLKEIMRSLITHLHGFVREVELTEEEWMEGIKFLEETGKIIPGEFILLSDNLGVSVLVDLINHRKPKGATENNLMGPFYQEGSPERAAGSRVFEDDDADPLFWSGQVRAPDGTPIKGALLDIWQTASNANYQMVDESQPQHNFRGKYRSGADGRYDFETVCPVSYPIPTEGSVGKLLKAIGRPEIRPAHVHFKVSADGYTPLTTMIFPSGDKYLSQDPVFGVRESLIIDVAKHENDEGNRKAPFYTAEFDFVLEPAA